MSILKWQVNSSSNFASFFIVMTQNSPVNFKLIHFLLWIKGPHQSPNFKTFQCSGENFLNSSCHFWKYKSVFDQVLHQSSVPSNVTPLYLIYLKHYIYTLVKGSPLKCKFLRFLSARVKIDRSPHLNFETASQFLFQFCIVFIVMANSSPVNLKLIRFLLWI